MQLRPRNQKIIHINYGLTIVEKLMLIAIIGVLSALSIPSYSEFLIKNHRRTALAAFHHSIMHARNEAFTKNQHLSICPSLDGKQCSNTKEFTNGWISFINFDRDSPVKRDQNEPLVQSIRLKKGNYKLIANRKAFTMRPYRKRSTNGTLVFCSLDDSILAKAIIVSYIGRPRLDEKPKDKHLKLCLN